MVTYLNLSGSEREVGWGGCLFEVGANSRLGAYSNKYGNYYCFDYYYKLLSSSLEFKLSLFKAWAVLEEKIEGSPVL